MYNKNDLLTLSGIYCKANLNLKKSQEQLIIVIRSSFTYIFFNFMHNQFWRGLRAGGKGIVKENRHNAKL